MDYKNKKINTASSASPFYKKGIYFLVLIFLTNCSTTQKITEDRATGRLPSLTTESYNNIEEIVWQWTELGPFKTPLEKNPGGRAIPSYSKNRGNGTGRVNFIYVNPNNPQNVFACSPTGGLFITKNGGDTWSNAGTDQLPISGVSSISVNPADQDQWIIATGDSDDQFKFSDGIWITSNAGTTWSNINGKGDSAFPVSEKLARRTYVSKVVAHPCDFNRVVVACDKGLFTTKNALDSPSRVKWKRVDDSFYFDIEIVPWDDSQIYAAGNRFLRSNDFGKTWETLPLPEWSKKETFPFLRLSLEFSPKDQEHLYCVVTNGAKVTQTASGEATLQKFNIEKKEWVFIRSLRKKMNNVITTRARAFAISPKDVNLILVANVQPIYRSIDGGLNFMAIEKRQMHDDIHHIEFAPNGQDVYASHDGGISKSTDGGLTWTIKDNGIGVANVFGVSVGQSEKDVIAYGGYDTGGNVLIGENWYHVLWGDGFKTIVNHSNPNELYVTRQGGYILRSDDGGISWENEVKYSEAWMAWHSYIRMNPVNEDIYGCGDLLSRSKDKGESWETLLNIPEYNSSWTYTYKLFVSDVDPGAMYAFTLTDKTPFSPVLIRTLDLEEENPDNMIWEEIEMPLDDWVSSVIVDPRDSEKFWLCYKSIPKEKMYYYDGSSFINVGNDLGMAEIASAVIDKNTNQLYVGTSYGVFTRNADETNWKLLYGLPGVTAKGMAINYTTQELVVGTFGRGNWKCPLYPN